MLKRVMLVLLACLLIVSVMPAISLNFVGRTELPSNSVFQAEGNETTPKYGGTLRVAIGVVPLILNPLVDVKSWLIGSEMIWLNIFDPLVKVDENGSFVPGLATSCAVSEDGRRYTFRLYQNVTWHDGIAFNSSDVKFTYDTIRLNPAVNDFWKKAVWDDINISSVEILNESAVVFHLEDPRATFLANVRTTPIIPFHLYEGTDIATNPHNDEPVGTGPFRFVPGWSPGENITLTANEVYFLGRPFIDTLFFQLIGFRERPQYLMNNSMDIVPITADPTSIEDLINVPGVSYFSQDSTFLVNMGVNVSKAILNETKVRKALSYAINRSEIIQTVFSGHATEATGPISPALTYWYNPNVTTYCFNQTLSEQLLNESGYLRDTETGIRFNLTLGVLCSSPYYEVGEMIKNYLERVGINVTFQSVNLDELNTLVFDLRVTGIGFDPYLKYQYNVWHSGGSLNLWSFNNSYVDSLLEEARETCNQTIRKQDYDQLQAILAEELPNVFICYRKMITAYNNDFHGFVESNYVYSLHSYSLNRAWYDPTLSGQGKSPVKVCFSDQEGRRTGFLNGSIVEEIPGSSYDEEHDVVRIRSPPETKIMVLNPDGPYTKTTTVEPSCFEVDVTGTDTGHYHLELVNVALEYKSVVIVEGDTYAGKVDRYWIVVYTNGLIYRRNCPPPEQIIYCWGHQIIFPAEGVDPEAYYRGFGTIVVR